MNPETIELEFTFTIPKGFERVPGDKIFPGEYYMELNPPRWEQFIARHPTYMPTGSVIIRKSAPLPKEAIVIIPEGWFRLPFSFHRTGGDLQLEFPLMWVPVSKNANSLVGKTVVIRKITP